MELTKMYTNGEYLKNNPEWGAGDAVYKAAWIKQIIQGNRLAIEEVVEVGTGTGALLKELRFQLPEVKKWYGYDIAPDAITIAKQQETGNLQFFNEDFLQTNQHADCLLVIDVVEHVPDYYQFLENLRNRSKYLVFHIPLDISCRTLLKPHVTHQQRLSVGHIHYFSRDMVWWMLQDTGYEILDWKYTKPMLDIVPPASVKDRIKKLSRNFFFRFKPNLTAKLLGGYSVMILAK